MSPLKSLIVLEYLATRKSSKACAAGPTKGNKMRPSFLINLDLKLVSALVSKETPHAIQVGTMMIVTADIDTPYGKIPADTKVHVASVDEEDGLTVLFAEGIVPALYNWNNQLVLVPFDTDDTLDRLVCVLRTVNPVKASTIVTPFKTA